MARKPISREPACDVPAVFEELRDGRLLVHVQHLSRRKIPGRYVAWFWQWLGDELGWIDSRGNAAYGTSDNWRWLCSMGPILDGLGFDFGSPETMGRHVLVWDQVAGRLWKAGRHEGLNWIEFLALQRRKRK